MAIDKTELAALRTVGDANAHYADLRQNNVDAIENAFNIGGICTDAKDAKKHGEWESFVAQHYDFSLRFAQACMKLHRDIKGLSKAQRAALLDESDSLRGITKALAPPAKPPKPNASTATDATQASLPGEILADAPQGILHLPGQAPNSPGNGGGGGVDAETTPAAETEHKCRGKWRPYPSIACSIHRTEDEVEGRRNTPAAGMDTIDASNLPIFDPESLEVSSDAPCPSCGKSDWKEDEDGLFCGQCCESLPRAMLVASTTAPDPTEPTPRQPTEPYQIFLGIWHGADAMLKALIRACVMDDEPPKPKKKQTFDDFWNVVHRKTGKEAARRAYKAAVARINKEKKDGTLPPTVDPHGYLILRMELFAKSEQAHPDDHTPIHPATWLNAGRYDDDETTWGCNGSHGAQRTVDQDLSRELVRTRIIKAARKLGQIMTDQQVEAAVDAEIGAT